MVLCQLVRAGVQTGEEEEGAGSDPGQHSVHEEQHDSQHVRPLHEGEAPLAFLQTQAQDEGPQERQQPHRRLLRHLASLRSVRLGPQPAAPRHRIPTEAGPESEKTPVVRGP